MENGKWDGPFFQQEQYFNILLLFLCVLKLKNFPKIKDFSKNDFSKTLNFLIKMLTMKNVICIINTLKKKVKNGGKTNARKFRKKH